MPYNEVSVPQTDAFSVTIDYRYDEVQSILKDASAVLGANVLSGIIAHITSEPDFLDTDLDLYHFFALPVDEPMHGKFRSQRKYGSKNIRFFMSHDESVLLIKTLTDRLSDAYMQDRSQADLRQYYVQSLTNKLSS